MAEEADMSPPTTACEVCRGSGRIDVLDVWKVQRAYIETGRMPEFDGADAFPLLKAATACPVCLPHDPDDMKALVARLGDPWNPETFKELKQ